MREAGKSLKWKNNWKKDRWSILYSTRIWKQSRKSKNLISMLTECVSIWKKSIIPIRNIVTVKNKIQPTKWNFWKDTWNRRKGKEKNKNRNYMYRSQQIQ